MPRKPYRKHPIHHRILSAYRQLFYAGALLLLFHLASLPLTAQAIGNWTFNNTLSGTPGLYNTVSSADFSASVPTRSFNSGTEYFGENGWPAGSANSSMYLQFSLSPLTGYQLDISSLVLRMRRSNTGSPAGAGPVSWALRSSIDGFSANIATGSITHNYADYSITPGAGFVNIYTTVTFRLYGYNTTVNSGGNSRLVFDNIRVNGIGYLLPVKLGAISARLAGEDAALAFTVYQTEINSRYYLERSTDGISFNTIYTLEETAALAEKTYTYTDNLPGIAGYAWYRVRLRNRDGGSSYSAVLAFRHTIKQAALKPYIKNAVLYLNGVLPAPGKYGVLVYTVSGQLMAQMNFTGTAGYNIISLPVAAQLPANCVVQISNQKGYSETAITGAR